MDTFLDDQFCFLAIISYLTACIALSHYFLLPKQVLTEYLPQHKKIYITVQLHHTVSFSLIHLILKQQVCVSAFCRKNTDQINKINPLYNTSCKNVVLGPDLIHCQQVFIITLLKY